MRVQITVKQYMIYLTEDISNAKSYSNMESPRTQDTLNRIMSILQQEGYTNIGVRNGKVVFRGSTPDDDIIHPLSVSRSIPYDGLTTKERDENMVTLYPQSEFHMIVRTDLPFSIANHIYERIHSWYHLRAMSGIMKQLHLSPSDLEPVQSEYDTVYRIVNPDIGLGWVTNQLRDWSIVVVDQDKDGKVRLTILDKIPKSSSGGKRVASPRMRLLEAPERSAFDNWDYEKYKRDMNRE